MPESYIKRNCKRILKIFQVQLSAAQQRENREKRLIFCSLCYRYYPVSTLLLSCIATRLVRHGLN